jgi:hypothetical protein
MDLLLVVYVSGLWGIFWYKEIKGSSTIAGWFASATVTVLGILWLSQERIGSTSSDADEDSSSPHRLLHRSFETLWEA